MIGPDRPSSPPQENSTPTSVGMPTEAWIMKGLNDLREDVKGIRDSISGVDKRVASLEKTVMRVLYGFGGAVLLALVIWALVQFAAKYVDIEIKAKDAPQEQS